MMVIIIEACDVDLIESSLPFCQHYASPTRICRRLRKYNARRKDNYVRKHSACRSIEFRSRKDGFSRFV